MTETRKRIADRIQSTPGIHFNGLVRRLDLAPGQVQYHLRQLIEEDRFVDERLYGQTHYYPPDYDAHERRTIALLRRETAAAIVGYLLKNGSTAPMTVAEELGIARSTLEWQLGRLTEQGLVRKTRDGDNRITLTIVHPTATVRLLHAADPTLFERLVDRFTGLIDSLLDE